MSRCRKPKTGSSAYDVVPLTLDHAKGTLFYSRVRRFNRGASEFLMCLQVLLTSHSVACWRSFRRVFVLWKNKMFAHGGHVEIQCTDLVSGMDQGQASSRILGGEGH